MFTEETKQEIEQREQQIAKLRSEVVALKRESAMPVQDYTLHDPDGNAVKLSAAFGDRDQLVLIHNMGFRCPYCTMWADGFQGLYKYIQRRAGFVLVSNDEPEKQKRGAALRGWTYPMLSSKDTTLFSDLGFQTEQDGVWPGVSTLKKNADGSLERTACDFFGPGDFYNSAWHFFDLLAPGAEEIEPTEGISDQAV
jgi:predicted dithiol-disulfide oxidoreductase (DUF899 family)